MNLSRLPDPEYTVLSNANRHCPDDGALDILLSASGEGGALYLTIGGDSGDHGEGVDEIIQWTARFAGNTGECSSGVVEPTGIALPFGQSVFERVLLSIRQQWPRESLARRLAGEIRRVLAPGGELLVTVPGRLGYRRVAGVVRPPVCEGGAVARARQRWQASLRLLSGWKGAPSRRALGHFLAVAGLAASEWFRPRRSEYGGLLEVEPLWSSRPHWLEYRTPPAWVRLRRSSWLVDEYAIRAGPARLGESVVEECLAELATHLGSPNGSASGPRVERYLVSAKEKAVLLLRLGHQRMVMRVPLTEAARIGCQRNHSALRVIADDPERRGLAPFPLDEGIVRSGHYYTLESRLEGGPVARGVSDERNIEQVEALLHHLNPEPKLRRARLEDDLYDRLVGQPLARIVGLMSEPEVAERLVRLFRDVLEGQQVTLGISHGDFSLSNIYVQDGRVCGLIDWDESASEGLPIEDAISHVFSRLARRSDNFGRALLDLAKREALSRVEDEFLQRCYAHFGIDRALHPTLTLLFWIRITDAQRDFAFARSTAYRESRIDGVGNAVVLDHCFWRLVV